MAQDYSQSHTIQEIQKEAEERIGRELTEAELDGLLAMMVAEASLGADEE